MEMRWPRGRVVAATAREATGSAIAMELVVCGGDNTGEGGGQEVRRPERAERGPEAGAACLLSVSFIGTILSTATVADSSRAAARTLPPTKLRGETSAADSQHAFLLVPSSLQARRGWDVGWLLGPTHRRQPPPLRHHLGWLPG